jgi:type I restriction enzyme, S subunit
MKVALPRGWRWARLDSAAKRGTGHTPSRLKPSYWGGDIRWVSLGDTIRLDRVWIDDSAAYITDEGLNNSSAVVHPSGTVVLLRGSSVGKSAIMRREMTVSQDYVTWTCGPELHNVFLYQWLQWMKPTFNRISNGSTIKTIGLPFFERLEIPLPPMGEQRAIGDMLLSWDDGARSLELLRVAADERKRGLMQQLLMGKARFGEFKGARWRTLRIGEVLEPKNRYEEWDDERLYRLAGVRRNGGGLFFRDELPGARIKVKVCKKIKAGDFLISRRQMTYGGMALVPADFEDYDVNDEYEVLVVRDGAEFEMKFFSYLAETPELKYAAYVASNGFFAERLRLNLDLDEFLGHRIAVPASVAELRKVVSVLDAATREIEMLQRQLELLKEQKRGLMQKLLTGEMRVKIGKQKAERSERVRDEK